MVSLTGDRGGRMTRRKEVRKYHLVVTCRATGQVLAAALMQVARTVLDLVRLVRG